MRAVGLRILKNRLSEYVRLARNGERVLITDRDRVVAELVPPEAGRAETVPDVLLAEAVRKGWVTPPFGGSSTPPARIPVAPFEALMRELAGDRGER